MDCTTLIFSCNRVLQLDGVLRALLWHQQDAEHTEIIVLFAAKTPRHAAQYDWLIRDFARYPFIRFVAERHFYSDVLSLLALHELVLFMVDDNIIVRDFCLRDAVAMLHRMPQALGFSLRLGTNTNYCHGPEATYEPPPFTPLGQGILSFDWTTGPYDFGYPLEVSSSLYRTDDMLPLLATIQFDNPNLFEALMSWNTDRFRTDKPLLLCYETSVTFCAPMNIVQTTFGNRDSGNPIYASEHLATRFARGDRLDIAAHSGFVPRGCHQVVDLHIKRGARKSLAYYGAMARLTPVT
jgi:hypothetical protein